MKVYDGRRDRRVFPTKRTVTVVSTGRQSCGGNDHMVLRRNGRVDWSLFYCETGCLYVAERSLGPGQLWIYPPGELQRYTMYSRDKTVYRYLHFTGSDVGALLEELGIALCTVLEGPSALSEILTQIQESVKGGDPVSVLDAERHVLQLLSAVAKKSAGASEEHMMKRITDSMEHSFAAPYEAAVYAGMLNVSVSRFNHLFKQYVGVAPYAYYVELRMANARSLLEETRLPIKTVAQLCGYEDALYFAQAFKKAVGAPPSVYRKCYGTQK